MALSISISKNAKKFCSPRSRSNDGKARLEPFCTGMKMTCWSPYERTSIGKAAVFQKTRAFYCET